MTWAAALLAALMLAGCVVRADFKMSCKGKDVDCSLDSTRKAESI